MHAISHFKSNQAATARRFMLHHEVTVCSRCSKQLMQPTTSPHQQRGWWCEPLHIRAALAFLIDNFSAWFCRSTTHTGPAQRSRRIHRTRWSAQRCAPGNWRALGIQHRLRSGKRA
jgi:hypothetical protein